jgi:hypothetical protein
MDPVREVLRYSHYASRTGQTSGQWLLRSLHYFGSKTHPNRLGTQEVERFLSHLAPEGQVSASTPRQVLNALVLLYRDVLHQPLASAIAPVRRTRRPWAPTVLTQAEVQRLLGRKDAPIHARRSLFMHHVRPNLTVPHWGDGRAPIIPRLALGDVKRCHFMHRGVFGRAHHDFKSSSPNVTRNALAQG